MTKTDIFSDGMQRVSQAARRLGLNRNTVYGWIKEGKIAYTRIHGSYRIPTRAVSEMLNRGLHLAQSAEE